MQSKIFKTDSGIFYNNDCFDIFDDIENNSIDMILCDLPYGTTQNKWDSVLPLEILWRNYWRIVKENAPIVLTAQSPFDKTLGFSQLNNLKYEWIWEKQKLQDT